jgi:transcriptional regulator with XRE-family HTH domain
MTNNIARLRTLKGVTMAGLSREAGMHRQTLYNLETGRARLYPGYRERIAKALGVDESAI